MRYRNEQFQRSAYHEAGHAVVGYLLDRPLIAIHLFANQDSYVEFDDWPEDEQESQAYWDSLDTTTCREVNRKFIMTSWAGQIAEELKFKQHDYHASTSDRECITEEANRLSLPLIEELAYKMNGLNPIYRTPRIVNSGKR